MGLLCHYGIFEKYDAMVSNRELDKIVAGAAWYKAGQWADWCKLCPDFEPTYSAWEQRAIESLLEMRRGGLDVKKVQVDVMAFKAWCAEHDRDYSAGSRTEYVTHLLQDMG